ncbi:MAG: ribosome small subunit-dependent GTPase A [Candidatus Wallbacteria bacterium HGW-Wallbacteria-1]|jgi:ribosome biogenesis GTPase|uniref:Small ribosomal subunit biogenesis GTPase RsgA n=1 Tax=Candidatus Wallbacteria bacterium HGW-Wallbacteria-1 TaxID=2013854 RepID=A0A2N1PPK8_9BACT|nr:MAG: ribosome small subunit-dependent GTPase A [Candidatus Wallbacteria bacterium HGW-Wallbacteria-1]
MSGCEKKTIRDCLVSALDSIQRNEDDASDVLERILPRLVSLGLNRGNLFSDPEISIELQAGENRSIGRVIEENREGYLISLENMDIYAEVAGRLYQEGNQRDALPAVGDWVILDLPPGQNMGIVQYTLPRTSALVRKMAGKREKVQVIAANVDRCFIIVGLDGNFNLRRMERFLVAVAGGGSHPVILLSKADLLEKEEIENFVGIALAAAPGIDVIPFSSVSGMGLERVESLLQPGLTVCFIGSSGVGKSTLLNVIAGIELAVTGEVRVDSKGRHTTTQRQIYVLDSGAMILDTPGIRELALWDATLGVSETFHDVLSFGSDCRFSDCTHVHEPGCGILKALDEGELSRSRYESFLKLNREASALEARTDSRQREARKKKERKISTERKKLLNNRLKK